MEEIFGILAKTGARHVDFLSDEASGLQAVLVLDDLTRGPGAGGIRTQPYPSVRDAVADAACLARSMTLKCALAGLDAGGGKVVVLDHPQMKREEAFYVLGKRIEELQGTFLTGADLGTTRSDLEQVAKATQYVHSESETFSMAVAQGVLACMNAIAKLRGKQSVKGLHIAIQGCGSIGAALGRMLKEHEVELTVCDVNHGKAEDIAFSLGAHFTTPAEIFESDCDILAPCAIGGVLTGPRAHKLKAWGVCGAANNILAETRVGAILKDRGILYVPDIVSSSGAVIEGIGKTVMGLSDRSPLIEALGPLAAEIIEQAKRTDQTPSAVAMQRAEQKLEGSKKAS